MLNVLSAAQILRSLKLPPYCYNLISRSCWIRNIMLLGFNFICEFNLLWNQTVSSLWPRHGTPCRICYWIYQHHLLCILTSEQNRSHSCRTTVRSLIFLRKYKYLAYCSASKFNSTKDGHIAWNLLFRLFSYTCRNEIWIQRNSVLL